MPEGLLVSFLVVLAPMVVMGAAEIVRQIRVFLIHPVIFWAGLKADPWPAASVLVCVIGIGGLAAIIWRNWVFIWAVARKLIIEAMHRKVVIVLLVFFIVLTLSLPFILKTEGSLKSQTQLLFLYSLTLGLTLLCVLAIFVSSASICAEVEHKHVQVTDTKPLARWQFLLGKWFGVVVMCSAILSVMAVAAAVITLRFVHKPDVTRMLQREAANAMANYNAVFDEVLVARRPLTPPVPRQAIERAEQHWQDLVRNHPDQLPQGEHRRERYRDQILRGAMTEYYTVVSGDSIVMEIDGLRPGDEGNLFVRWFALASKPGDELLGTWVVFKRELAVDEKGGAVLDDKGNQTFRYVPVYVVQPPVGGYAWAVTTKHEFQMPAKLVPPDGRLFFQYENLNPQSAAMFGYETPLQVLQEQGSFWPNYYRALLVLLCHVALLAALGVMAGAVFSFPVASLTVAFIFIVGLIGPWFGTLLEPLSPAADVPFWTDLLLTAWRRAMGGFLAVMPHFGRYNPLGDLTDGVTVPWSFVAAAGAVMVFIKGAAATLVGMYFYARRELARVIV
jgi:hypothetical protein